MELGTFSISLTVKDLAASLVFYRKLGFKTMGGHDTTSEGWAILQGSGCTIGLFQGMFDKNMLTFNPGWNASAQRLDDFEDIRDIQKKLRADGVEFVVEADETTSGPASLIVHDPDGNPVMLDQHV